MYTHSNGQPMQLPDKLLAVSDKPAWIALHAQALKGVGITQSDGARKYKIVQATISNWVRSGFIARLGQRVAHGGVLIDEADLAYCAAVAKASGKTKGRKLFNPDGSIYIPPKFRH